MSVSMAGHGVTPHDRRIFSMDDEIDIEDWHNGMYYIELVQEGKKSIGKFLKN